jgi:hypothetical protein
MKKMLSNSLSAGDKISVKAWFGWTEMHIKNQDNKIFVMSLNGDVKFPVSALSFTSREITPYSKWKYLGRLEEIEAQYIEYEEEVKEDDNLLEQFLKI